MTLDTLLATYGDPFGDPNFERTNIVRFDLPYALIFKTAMVWRARCHRLAVAAFQQAFQAIKDAGLTERATEYGGIFAIRAIRGFPKYPSAHAFGMAIDLNPVEFPLGSTRDQDAGVTAAFEAAGFFYGGKFQHRHDAMHYSLTGF